MYKNYLTLKELFAVCKMLLQRYFNSMLTCCFLEFYFAFKWCKIL